MIAYWVHNWDPFAVQFGGGFGVRWYGLAYLAAFAASFFLYRYLAQRGFAVIPADKVGDFMPEQYFVGLIDKPVGQSQRIGHHEREQNKKQDRPQRRQAAKP